LREYGRFVAAISFFVVLSIACGAYIQSHQRLRTPFQDSYEVRIEMPTSQSLTSGKNQPVNVAGVRVGDVVRTSLREGRAIVTLSIDRGELPAVYRDARAQLRPNTPLKDMQIELFPGRRAAGKLGEGGTVAVARTTVPVDSDDFTAALDADTRAYFQALVAASERGLRGRGRDLRAALRALGPTTEQLRQLGDGLAGRRRQLARLVHNLALLSRAAAAKDRELGTVVRAGATTLRAIAGQDAALRDSVSELPGTLSAARSSLVNATALADEVGPTLRALDPTARRLPRALRAADPLLRRFEPLVRTRLRPLVREAGPLVADLSPAIANLRFLSPHLKTSFAVFDYVANELAHNPAGSEEGYLFWLAWFAHNANSALSTQDAHGPLIRGLALVSCSTVASQPDLAPVLQALTGVVPACP
ncbi:MAG: phospholipid/cholesterol/gamma-HCH transport system substrate-binding protein, partial [Candidatus Eremiobacteraeota bacterium]|nr:phospholipid/cholesterol/gamma-HCH transport system substrate-binding protein [Candidatus Eremiobacteraeota bacterium]